MSINWVMLDGSQGFVRLPGERIIHTSSPRIALALTTPTTYPGNNPLSIHCNSGIAYLTNQRIVYLPEKATPEFQSFSAPLLNLHDSHPVFPWFGPNSWQSVLQPVPGGNLPSTQAAIELKLTFKEGGVTDFSPAFKRIKERLQQVVSAARAENQTGRRQDSYLGDVNLENVHLDQLPSYQESGHDRVAPVITTTDADDLIQSPGSISPTIVAGARRTGSPAPDAQPPSDAPPGYEETQQQSIQAELDRRFSQTQS
ncbi:hypothetical protein LTR84_002130 [Exophiala bonariae]|uniref:Uncharacterized protein n=1 Tax=Exophiala bonariae TaxID=1690606 RepID=A0AAV9NAJ4_9EURO|nr:hypothetical protein LTR84_002130 [Exophiala bonariae]